MNMDDIRSQLEDVLGTRVGQLGAGALAVAGTLAASYYFSPSPKPFTPMVDPNKQSIDIGDGVRASPLLNELPGRKLLDKLSDDTDTVYGIFLSGLKKSRHRKCIGKRCGPLRQYEYLTYQQVYDRARAFGSGLIKLGLLPSPETFVGIYSMNRVEFLLTQIACHTYSMATVALYDTLGPTACQFIINHMDMATVVCDTCVKAKKLINNSNLTPTLKLILVMDEVTDEIKADAENNNIRVISFTDVEAKGRERLEVPVPPKPTDLAAVSFTSGTTGDPKGVMLTHRNFAALLAGLMYCINKQYVMSPVDVHLSYLPMAHLFEQSVLMAILSTGGSIGIYSGDIKLLLDDLQTVKPTIFATVPRLLSRVRDKIYTKVRTSAIKSRLLNWGLESKLFEVQQGIVRRDSLWDRLVFGKIQAMYGGRVNLLITGSAPIPAETLNFFKCALGCVVIEAYGQTEGVSAITGTFAGDTTSGHVGTPYLCNYVKLVDVPDMNYFAKDNKGEVCVFGPNVSSGYYKNPEKTAETFDKDGWLHTGDIGVWLPNGALKLIDRKKHIFKLAQGEYVAPEKIESVYVRSEFVAQVFIDGDSFKTCCMGVVVPDQEVIDIWAPNHGFPSDIEQLCQSEEVKNIILKDLIEHGKKSEFKGFEQVKDIYLHPDPFTLENGLLTPTFKSKRPQLRQRFKSQFQKMYKNHEM